jgi:predicted dinucleotide-binding enzyme
MRVAVIGVGNVGGALASALTKAGHQVVVAASDAERAEQVAAGLKCEPAPNPAEASRDADAVVLAIPFSAGRDVAEQILPNVTGKPVIDVTNSSAVVESGSSDAEAFQEWLPDAHIVKAFNTVFASRLADPTENGEPLDGFIAGDDPDAKSAVGTIVRDAGLAPLDIGGLKMARALEAMAWANISVNMANNWPWHSAWKLAR